MAERLEISLIVKALAEGFEKLKQDVVGVGQAGEQGGAGVDKTSTSLAGLGAKLAAVAAAAVAFGTAAKGAFEMAEAGAAVVQTRESFDGLLETIGAAPDLLDQLKAASNGTISEMSLMSSTAALLAGTGDEMARSMAEAAPQIMEIAKAANKLGPTLGSTEFLYQSLMTGIKRGSPLLIDNTGLTVRLGEANETLAQQLGKTVEELSAEEQKQALLNAVMQAGDNLIRQVGGTTDSATDVFAEFRTVLGDAADEAKARLVPAVAAVVQGLLDMWQASEKAEAAGQNIIETNAKTATSYDDYRAAMEQAAAAMHLQVVETEDGIQVFDNSSGVVGQLSDKIAILDQASWSAIKSAEGLDGSYQDVAGSAEASGRQIDYAAAMTEYNKNKAEELKTALNNLNELMRTDFTQTAKTFGEKMAGLTAKLEEQRAKAKELEALRYKTPEQQAELDALQGEIGETKGAITELADEHDAATARILYNMMEQRLATDGFTDVELKFLGEMAEKWGLIDDNTAIAADGMNEAWRLFSEGKITEALAKLEAVKNKILDIPTVVDVQVNVNVDWQGELPPGADWVPRASGGPMSAGKPYLVGENGPELVVPTGDRWVYNAAETQRILDRQPVSGAGSTTIQIFGLNLYGVQDRQSLLAELQKLQ